MIKSITFIAGIHGVGKTTFCKKNFSNIPHYSCSNLISKFKNLNFKNKETEKINENQKILELAINTYLDNLNEFILDGHFCLLDSNLKITRIPLATFINLKITKIVILITDIEIILKNLKLRDNKEYDYNLISEFQKEELKFAKEISKYLNIPIDIIDPYKIQEAYYG